MNVLFLNPVGTLGGGERSLLDTLAVLGKLRPDLALRVIAGADGPLVQESARLGAVTEVVPMPSALAGFGESGLLWAGGRFARVLGLGVQAARAGLAVPGYLRRLRRAVARHRPRLIHSNGVKCHLLAGFAAPARCPVVWHVRDFLSSRPLLGRGLKRLARMPAAVVANSEATAADTRLVLPGVRVEAVYNGIDTGHFVPPGAAADLDVLAGLPPAEPGTLRVGLVATYARWKGQDVFLAAAAELVKAGLPGVRFYVVGGAVYSTGGSQFSESELRARASELGIAGRCGFVPFQQSLPPIYRALDVVVHASTRPEPFGRTIVEAMACGRAVVVAAAGGAAELFADGVNALGRPPGDVPALARAIRALAEDASLRARLGANARETAVTRFDVARYGPRLLGVYRSVVGEF
ncbi:MAG: glycosyltransferase family 4 protein [Gemmataceae bacterium]|nr:glycosyltransferase family 4 protein [Gemmataceae bacterium]